MSVATALVRIIPSKLRLRVIKRAPLPTFKQADTLAELVDRCGVLKERINKFNRTTLAEWQELSERLRTEIDARVAPNEQAKVKGEKWLCTASVKPNESECIDNERVLRLLAARNAIEKLRIPITLIRDELTSDECDKVLRTEQTGTRRLGFERA